MEELFQQYFLNFLHLEEGYHKIFSIYEFALLPIFFLHHLYLSLNKDDARKKWGEEQIHIWRRSYDIPPPDGESLKNTAERVLPYFNKEILPKVISGSNILIAAHGNSLRSLIMQLDELSKDQILNLNLISGLLIIHLIA